MIVSRTINDISFAVNINKPAGLLCLPEIAERIDNDVYEFVEYLYETKNKYTPMIATWEITNGCNFKCPFCYINTPARPAQQTQNFQTLKPVIDALVEKGLLLVYLTGGEILSVPDFKDIYIYLKQKGVFVVLLTNLSLLTDLHLQLFKEYPPLRVTASIYGFTGGQFSEITGQPSEMCATVFHNILRLKNAGIHVTCQTPVNRFTIGDILKIADWCYSNGIRFTCSNELTDSYYNESRSSDFVSNEEFDRMKARMRQIEPIKSARSQKIIKQFGYKHYFDCVSGKHTFAISSDLHVRPCFNIWEKDLVFFDGSVSIKEAMEEMEAFVTAKQKEILEGCKGCEASKLCGECIYTRNKQKDNLETYIASKCAENLKKINSLFP